MCNIWWIRAFHECQPKCSTIDPITIINVGINESQKKAIEYSIASHDISIIHGPPGTGIHEDKHSLIPNNVYIKIGKTTTLVELIQQCVLSKNYRILVCGPSNVSVDNVLTKLVQQNKKSLVPSMQLTRVVRFIKLEFNTYAKEYLI